MIKSLARSCAGVACRASGRLARAERENVDRLTILCYHRVLLQAEKDLYFQPDLVVTPRAFDAHCRVLSRHFEVLPLVEAFEALETGNRRDRRLAAITFDDGYVDNFEHAAPALARHGLTATFFVVAGLSDSAEPPWYDVLARAVQVLSGQRRLPDALDDPSLTALLASPGTSARSIVAAAKLLGPDQRQRLVAQLADAAGLGEDHLATDRIMSRDQIRQLADVGHEIGSHSLTHEILPLLNDEQLESEVAGSRRVLEKTLGRPVRSFCYPNGDVDDRVASAVASAGYSCAAVVTSGNNSRGGDAYRLRRWFVHEGRLSGPMGRSSPTLLRLELSGLADSLFRRTQRKAASA